MMLASRRFKATLLIVWILVCVCNIVFQVYDAYGHGWNPIQSTSTSTSVTTNTLITDLHEFRFPVPHPPLPKIASFHQQSDALPPSVHEPPALWDCIGQT